MITREFGVNLLKKVINIYSTEYEAHYTENVHGVRKRDKITEYYCVACISSVSKK